MSVSRLSQKNKGPNLAPSLPGFRWLTVKSIVASRPLGHLVRHFASAVRPESLCQRRIHLSSCTPGFRVSTPLNSSTLIPASLVHSQTDCLTLTAALNDPRHGSGCSQRSLADGT